MVDGAGGAVHQLGGSVRDRDRLEEGLGLRDDGRLVRLQAPEAELGGGDDDGLDVLVVVLVAAALRWWSDQLSHRHHHRLHHDDLKRLEIAKNSRDLKASVLIAYFHGSPHSRGQTTSRSSAEKDSFQIGG